MSSAPTAQEIAEDARWLAQALDPSAGMVRLIAMDADSYRAASFLDDRMLQQPVDTQIVPWPVVEEAAQLATRRDARWIFHIGHVGSTLMSRLLGEFDAVLAVREPRLLRDLALSPAAVRASYIDAATPLMSRTFSEAQLACVKATSFASEIAPELVPPGERAIFMYASPANYIPSILAGENSMKELHMLAPSRSERFGARVRALPSPRHDADLAAFAWACEMTALEAAAEAMPDRSIQWLDFDVALNRMEHALGASLRFLGIEAGQSQIATVAHGPLMRRYSKAPEYEYSRALRADLIAEASHRHRASLHEALAMLERSAQESPLLARALARSRTEA